MKLKDLIEPNELDLKGSPLKLPSIYDKKNINIGAGTKIQVSTAEIKDTKTGVVYCRRSLYQKA